MASPFEPRLGTNYCPTDQELLEIQALLVEPLLRMKHLDGEIANLQKAIDKFAQERDGVGAFVKAHQALISPVRRLPLDIIQEIFLACLPTHRNCVMSAKEPPVLLGRICSSWRAISLSTPRLWAKIHLVRPSRPPSDSAFSEIQLFGKILSLRLETFKDWLLRSGECALSISLEECLSFRHMPAMDFGTIPEAHIVRESSLYLQALISFASRWRDIKISTQAGPVLMETLSTLTARDVPMLQDLTIRDRLDPMDPDQSSRKCWASVGMLGGLALTRFSLSTRTLGLTELPVRWSQLASLSLKDASWNSPDPLTTGRALHILSRCPVLTSCRMAVYDNDESMENPVTGPIVECPHLGAMDLSCASNAASTFPRMFRRLVVPGLRKFVFRGYSNPETHSSLSISFFLATVTRLETLDISTDTFSKASLTELLRGLPTIRRLQVQHTWASPGRELAFEDDILDLLTPPHDHPSPCCPALQELIMRQCSAVSDAALLRLINARMTAASCSPLKRVDVEFCRERQVDILPDLRQFQDTGFHISLQYLSVNSSELFSPWIGLDGHVSWGDLPFPGPRSTSEYGF
ncbi:hypothetical protein C8R47DRAFT_1123877 [Mycena vitilis]|nr:hypothetical protein C8R47DRAFT_1123877 [Mycena vitilis]